MKHVNSLIAQSELQDSLQIVLPDLRKLLQRCFEIGRRASRSSNRVRCEDGGEYSNILKSTVEALSVEGNWDIEEETERGQRDETRRGQEGARADVPIE